MFCGLYGLVTHYFKCLTYNFFVNYAPTIGSFSCLWRYTYVLALDFVVALTLKKLSTTIEINNPQYKYAREACLQFLTLVGESPKWNVLDIPWALVLYAIYICTCTQACGPHVYISHKVLVPMV